jgi:hypothetical protein
LECVFQSFYSSNLKKKILKIQSEIYFKAKKIEKTNFKMFIQGQNFDGGSYSKQAFESPKELGCE